MSQSDDFFESQKEGSLIKSVIVSKYFSAWSNVLLKSSPQRIGYVDLYAGKGKFDDGSPSTPLLIMQNAIDKEQLKKSLFTVFNDSDAQNLAALKENITELPEINKFQNKPELMNQEVNDSLIPLLKKICGNIPVLSFLDPWGYKGITKDLIGTLIGNFGSDVIVFFSYKRINAAITNKSFEHRMVSLFGENALAELRTEIGFIRDPEQREKIVIKKYKEAIKGIGGRFAVEYCFKDEGGTRTSHYIFLFTKHQLGIKIMKDIMAKLSPTTTKGIQTFTYTSEKQISLSFEESETVERLASQLLESLRGHSLTVKNIIESHGSKTKFLDHHYKEALLKLEEDGKIYCNPPASERPKRNGKVTMGGNVEISFLEKGKDL